MLPIYNPSKKRNPLIDKIPKLIFQWVLQYSILWVPYLCLLTSTTALAVRPFVTDDARIVSVGQLELETFPDYTTGPAENMFSWTLLVGYTFTEWLELIVGTTLRHTSEQFIQPKFLLWPMEEDSWLPGLSLSLGYIRDWRPNPKEKGIAAYSLLLMSWSLLGDVLLIHLNVGPRWSWIEEGNFQGNFWGLGFDKSIFDPRWRLIVEAYKGDPFDLRPSQISYQYGVRFLKSDYLNFDITLGQQPIPSGFLQIGSGVEHWYQIGIRVLIDTILTHQPSGKGANGLWNHPHSP